jgi:hypothetical protein
LHPKNRLGQAWFKQKFQQLTQGTVGLRRFGIASCRRLSARLVCGYVYALLVRRKRHRANQNEDRNDPRQHKADS